MIRSLALVVLPLALLPALPAAAGPVAPTDLPASVQEYADSRGRGEDQLANPEFRAATAPLEAAFVAAAGADGGRAASYDPYRATWKRGVTVDFPLRTRYGARLQGTLYAPPAARKGRFPAVVYVAGLGTPDQAGQAVAQSLAEAGYVVWTITAHDSPGNEAAPPDPDPSTPANELCQPGAWQQPQEFGIRETGPCAGQVPPPDTSPAGTIAALRGTPSYYTDDPVGFLPGLAAYYDVVRAARVFPALDAADQLLSARNPLLARIDPQRLGIVGWSLGAHAALLAGNGDPRFSAVVTHDSFGRLGSAVEPRVPTLFLHHDLRNDGVRTQTSDLSQLPGALDAKRFVAAGVPTGLVVPRASRHGSFAQLNYALLWGVGAAGLYPDAPVSLTTPRDSERVIIHYTQAWLDRFLKRTSGPDRRSLDDRLVAGTFDGSSDSSSIGQGTWSPLTGNTPYTVAGETTAVHLSPFARSFMSLPGRSCSDLRRGC